jgi:predicted permease
VTGGRPYFRLRSRGPELAAQTDEEIELHLELRTEHLIACGMTPAAARAEAERRFGGEAARAVLRGRAEQRERRVGMREWLGGLGDDVRFGVRALTRDPLLAVVVVITLGLGIGANATIFGLVDDLLLRGPAHVESPEQLRRVYVTQQHWDGWGTSATTPYVAGTLLREMDEHFAGVSMYRYGSARIGSGESVVDETVGYATADMFGVLGVAPALGRFFTEEEDAPFDAAQVAVLSHEVWRSRFGGRSDVVGQTVRVDGASFLVIGVAPPGFTGPERRRAGMWIPFSAADWKPGPDWPTTWKARWTQVLVRMRPDASLEGAESAATSLFRSGAADAGNEAGSEAAVSLRATSYTVAGEEPAEAAVSRWLAGISVVVLLVACANVVNLLLARGVRRRREIAVRLALGVSRLRLARLLLAESLLLAAAGGVLALLLAVWGGRLLRAVLPPEFAWSHALDVRTLVFSGAVVLLTGLVVGLAPAMQAWRQDVTGMLKGAAPQGGAQQSHLRGALTVMQATFAMVLLVGAGLFVRSLWNVNALDLGIDADRVVVAWISYPDASGLSEEQMQAERERRTAFRAEAVARLRTLPDVESAVLALGTPLEGSFGVPVRVPGRDSLPTMPGGGPFITAAAPGYFETVGTRVLRGRGFMEGEGATTERVVVVNETMARTVWPGEDPLGRCVMIGSGQTTCSRVVGVVQDAKRRTLTDEPALQYYIPLGQESSIGGTHLLVRPVGDPARYESLLRRQIHAWDANVEYVSVRRLANVLDPQVRPWRLGATVFLVFGGIALIIAGIGLYSVIGYSVAQRRIEFGVRLALGQRAGGLIADVLRSGLRLVLVGIALGLPLALLAGRRIESLLFQTTALDPVIYAIVGGVLVVVAVTACIIPASRAGRIDPAVALRGDA